MSLYPPNADHGVVGELQSTAPGRGAGAGAHG